MKGIILAGGKGSRLFPLTFPVCKQLLPVYDKPMVYYPLCTLILAKIREILIISTPQDKGRYKRLFGNGRKYGLSIAYATQKNPTGGLAEAFSIGRDHIGDDASAMILGDNIFHADHLQSRLIQATDRALNGTATIFAQEIEDVSQLGVVELDKKDGHPIRFVEKPTTPVSNWAVLGLYFVPPGVSDFADAVQPSGRGQKEILDVMGHYLKSMEVVKLGRGNTWFDCGTCDDLNDAANFVEITQRKNRMPVGYIEEAAYRSGFIDKRQFLKLARDFKGDGVYQRRLLRLAEEAQRP